MGIKGLSRQSLFTVSIFLCIAFSLDAYAQVSNRSLARCNGLFLVDTDALKFSGTSCQIADTLSVSNYKVFGGFSQYRISGRWTENWDLKFNSEDHIGSAGIESGFKNISFRVAANSLPFLISSLGIHTTDSAFYASTAIGKGKPHIGTLRWNAEIEEEGNLLNRIEADWESNQLYKSISFGRHSGRHAIDAELHLLESKPENRKEPYFIKDSIKANLFNVKYAYSADESRFSLLYTDIHLGATLYGTMYRDNSLKRFMYVPIKGKARIGEIRVDRERYGVNSTVVFLDAQVKKSKERFQETLAPNRLLPQSIMQTLSFPFLQKAFRIDADADVFLATAGGYYQHPIPLHKHLELTPKIDVQWYFTQDEINERRDEETQKLIALNTQTFSLYWRLKSIGCLAGLGLSFGNPSFSLEWSAKQLIPFYIKYKTFDCSKQAQEGSADEVDKKNADDSNASAFKNGFASSLTLKIKI